MKQGLLTLAAFALAAAAAGPASALNTGSIPNFDQGTVTLAQAYPCVVGTYPESLGIADPRVWSGVCTPGGSGVALTPGTPTPPGAAPADLCLARTGLALNAACFAVVPSGQFGPCFVQSYRLIKQVPGSFKCPDVYGLPHFHTDSNGNIVFDYYTYYQFGTGVRTWWALSFTQPGTKFILEVISVCRATDSASGVPGTAVVHKDTWTWRVTASVETMANVIEVMHGGAVSTLEVPCILGEDLYDALKDGRGKLAAAIATGNRLDIGNKIFDLEALIVSNCLFADVLDPLKAYPGTTQNGILTIQPPGNVSQRVSVGSGGIAGIIDTIENPCCCKLLVDLEWIALKNGIIGQTPTLPIF